MSDTDKLFTGSIAEFYDTYLVPLIFESYADDLARRTAEGASGAVLETAAGSGAGRRWESNGDRLALAVRPCRQQ